MKMMKITEILQQKVLARMQETTMESEIIYVLH